MSSALEDVESSFDARMTYRDSWIVCEDQMSVACARTAADRAAHPIIWVKTPEEFGLQLDAMAAAKGEARSFAAQELKGGDFVVSVVSGFKGGMTGIRAGTVSANGRKAEIWEDEDAVELRWSSGGIQYHVGVVALGLRPGSEWDERSLAEAVFRRLLVSSPAT